MYYLCPAYVLDLISEGLPGVPRSIIASTWPEYEPARGTPRQQRGGPSRRTVRSRQTGESCPMPPSGFNVKARSIRGGDDWIRFSSWDLNRPPARSPAEHRVGKGGPGQGCSRRPAQGIAIAARFRRTCSGVPKGSSFCMSIPPWKHKPVPKIGFQAFRCHTGPTGWMGSSMSTPSEIRSAMNGRMAPQEWNITRPSRR